MPKAGKGKAQALEVLHQTIEGGTQDQNQAVEQSAEHVPAVLLNGAEAPAEGGNADAAVEVLHQTIEGEGNPKTAEAALDVLHQTIESGHETGNGHAAQPQPERSGVSGLAEQPARQASRLFVVAGGTSREAVRHASRNVQGLTETGAVLARGFQDLSREWMNFTQQQFRANLNGLTGLVRCRTPQDVLELQTTVVRENLQGAWNSARRVSEISTEVAKEVARTIGSRAV